MHRAPNLHPELLRRHLVDCEQPRLYVSAKIGQVLKFAFYLEGLAESDPAENGLQLLRMLLEGDID